MRVSGAPQVLANRVVEVTRDITDDHAEQTRSPECHGGDEDADR
jgi:hypothetical protein